jgi:hypothetical protein
MTLPWRLHRRIEKDLRLEKGCLRDQVRQLKKMGYRNPQILLAAKGCLEWIQLYDTKGNFVVCFQMYISCLKHPLKEAS